MKTLTLSDFVNMGIIRTNDKAEIIFDYFQGDPNDPVRLMGFQDDAWKSNFEISENGFYFWQELLWNSQQATAT